MYTPGPYSPGPWTAEGERILRGSSRLATIHAVDGLRSTLDANARLIAAAPMLLEALERLIRSNFQHGMVKVTPTMFGIIEQAREAIKQAKGD